MARNTPGHRAISVEVLEELIEAMHSLADANRRTFREEVNHAFQRHVEAPPVTETRTPPLPRATSQPSPETRGRKSRKAEG